MNPADHLWILPAFFAVAALYGSVGHGGASGYLAVMALAGFAPATMRPTALVLNVVVSLLAGLAYFRRGYFRGGLFWPLAAGSVPMAYVGGLIHLPSPVFKILLGVALAFAALRLVLPADEKPPRPAPPGLLISIGAVLGLVSGLIGVGGGIFLTPLLILGRWAAAKTAAGISAPFILVNSIAGLVGMGSAGSAAITPVWPALLAVVLVGGAAGAAWGSGPARVPAIKAALSLVLTLATVKLLITI